VLGSAVGHALRLLVLDDARAGMRAAERWAGSAQVLEAADLIGVLAREFEVRVLNISGSGCLLETASTVESGTAATLTLRVADEELADGVRVTRCDRLEGAGTRCLLGAELLWTTPPGPASLRRAARDPRRILSAAARVAAPPPVVM
jgi:hypothetical protein